MKIPAIIACSLCGAAVRAQIGPPQLGIVQDGGRLRPVYGIPAAAAVLGPLDYGREFARVAISPRQDYAIASDSGDGVVLLVLPGAASPVPGAGANPDRIAISPRGSAAALWFSSVGRLQIVSGLPRPASVRDVPTAFFNELPSALAVSDDGALAAGAWPDGVYSFGSSGQVTRIPTGERVAALAFYGASHDLTFATRLRISKIANAGSAGAISTLYRAGPLDPVGLALSWDNRRLTLAERAGSLLTLDLESGAASRLDCGCSPEGVFPMGASVFRITAFDGATFQLLDPSAGSLFFVPLASPHQASLQSGAGQ